MKPKLKPDLNLDSIQQEVIDEVVSVYDNGTTSLRNVARETGFSMTKVRKILITAGAYSTEKSETIGQAYKSGISVEEIANTLDMTVSNVYLYLPYKTILYNLRERSVDADRMARYRERLKQSVSTNSQEDDKVKDLQQATTEHIRARGGTMYIAINEKLRKYFPEGFCSTERDPGENYKGSGFDPEDPPFYLWYADLTANGRGKNRKVGMMIENSRCGYAFMMPIPEWDSILTSTEDTRERQRALNEYRNLLSGQICQAMTDSLLRDYYPEMRVYDKIGNDIIYVKAARISPSGRVQELCKELQERLKPGEDPLDCRVSNTFDRKFGNSGEYRSVEEATAKCLGMDAEDFTQYLKRKYAGMF